MPSLPIWLKTSLVIIGIWLTAELAILIVLFAALYGRAKNPKRPPSGRTVLLTGGKMTKCLQLARLFKANGDRVIVAETPLYKWCGTRYSNAVDRFVVIPEITGDGTAYQRALVELAKRENVDLFVPVASPKAALVDAAAKPLFPSRTQVFHFDLDIVQQLDDKHRFTEMCRAFGLSAPESHLIESPQTILEMDYSSGKKYILKKIEYDPVYRMDLRPLPHPGWRERVAALPISPADRWVMQEFIEGREICTHTTTQDGKNLLYICCDSSPFQVNYAMLDLPKVRRWVDTFIAKLGATGQISFDFMIRADGEVMPIECNPRTHSAITLMHNQPEAAAAYYPKAVEKRETYVPNATAGHTYWTFHELYRLLKSDSRREARFLLHRMWTGKEAVFRWDDPWPFFCNNYLSIPYQLLRWTAKGMKWSRIDFNIGKIIVPNGD